MQVMGQLDGAPWHIILSVSFVLFALFLLGWWLFRNTMSPKLSPAEQEKLDKALAAKKDKETSATNLESESLKPSEAVTSSEPVAAAANMETAMQATRASIWGRIKALIVGSELQLEDIEEVLYTSDIGPQTVQKLIQDLDQNLPKADRSNEQAIKSFLKTKIFNIFDTNIQNDNQFLLGLDKEAIDLKPVVWMIIGVNGAGKTTSIGKLSAQLKAKNKSVIVAAADTFRAAADEQLKTWCDRAGVELYSPQNVKDPSAVAFEAINKAKQQGVDHVIIDTAGRLHTQQNLMEELKKMRRVIDKAMPGAPHEVLLVLDANNGQNALIQAKEFHTALGITGVIFTKMDSSAKGGVAIAVAHEMQIPIKRIGIGEKIEDLQVFSAQKFVDAIF